MRLAGCLPRSTAARVGGAAVAMVLAAELAVWLLSTDDTGPKPDPVSESAYFTPQQLERADDFRGGQRWLLLLGLAVEGGVLVAVVAGRPAFVRRALRSLAARPLRGAALAGVSVAALTQLALLPVALASHERAVDAGISTQSLSSWLWDYARSAAITIAITAAGAALLLALVRRFPRRWWMPGALAVTALGAFFVWVAPIVLSPIFNRFETLPPSSRARSEVLELARRAGIEVDDVYKVDASRRVRTLNAYVDGIGSTRRVVLYDNLLRRAERPELRSVVAHELGHVAHDDVPRGIAFVALVAPLGLVFARELALALTRRTGVDAASPAAIPAYLLALSLAAFVLNVPGNQLSRKVEASADAFALELTGDPQALVDLQVQLARTNLSDPDPPDAYSFVFGTHPTTVQRIGAALAFEREAGR
ncbi:MAG TPA: M48 family metalloprotease [Solirubrobacterales bacterium]|nr:M48 family metalloprotease [Solirubrobacterales bacterium]